MPVNYTSYGTPRADLGEAIREFNPVENGFIAGMVLPDRPVMKKAAAISVITRESILKRADAKHSNGAAFNRVGIEAEDTSYECIDYGLEGALTDDDRANYATDFDAELETTESILHKLLMEREIRVAAAVFNSTTWTGASLYTDVSAAPWDAAASDVISHVLAAKEKVRTNIGMEADAMIIGPVMFQNLLGNTVIRARFPGAPIITEAMLRANLAAIFGLQYLLVGSKRYDSANEGIAFSGSDVWSDDYAMICKLNTGSLRSGGLGRTFVWSPLQGAGSYAVKQYREEQTESDIFRVRQYADEKIFDAYFGHLLKIDA